MNDVLIDTNLLVLLIVGLYNKRLIKKHKRTRTYTQDDFALLLQSLECYDKLWFTSHSLAEVSNLLKQTNNREANQLLLFLKTFISTAKESHYSKDLLFKNKDHLHLGVTDLSILLKSKRVGCVFTVDLDLYLSILKLGYNVVNFNHLRVKNLLS